MPGVVATPASCITRLAVALSPIAAMTLRLRADERRVRDRRRSRQSARSRREIRSRDEPRRSRVISAVEMMFGMLR